MVHEHEAEPGAAREPGEPLELLVEGPGNHGLLAVDHVGEELEGVLLVHSGRGRGPAQGIEEADHHLLGLGAERDDGQRDQDQDARDREEQLAGSHGASSKIAAHSER